MICSVMYCDSDIYLHAYVRYNERDECQMMLAVISMIIYTIMSDLFTND